MPLFPCLPVSLSPCLVFPDPQVDIARVRAKQIMARLFRGENEGLQEELQAFTLLHAKAEGNLAGRKGNYAEILQTLTKQSDPLALSREATPWTTFAGTPSRNLVLSLDATERDRLLRLCRYEPQWCFNIQKHSAIEKDEGRRMKDENKPQTIHPSSFILHPYLPYHPLIMGDSLLVAEAHALGAFDLRTGNYTMLREDKIDKPAEQPKPRVRDDDLEDRPAPKREAPHTLTVAHDKVVTIPDKTWFEGAPLVYDGRAYVAVTRFTGADHITAIHCYAVEGESNPGRTDSPSVPLWKRDVCAVRGKDQRDRHHLLTLAGPNVVYCSHSGAVVAVDALTGQTAWAVRMLART